MTLVTEAVGLLLPIEKARIGIVDDLLNDPAADLPIEVDDQIREQTGWSRAWDVITIVRLRHHQPTRDYVERRTAEGLSKREIIRCQALHRP